MHYWSFPIPLWKEDFTSGIIPRLDLNILSISKDKERLSLEVKFSDLMECCQLNSIYLCDHHGVLDQSTGDSCIGALYSQQLDDALTLCPMEVVQLQLYGNHFVILNNATGFNKQKDCINGPSLELSLPIATQILEPGCTLKLCDHVIFANSLVHLKTNYHTIHTNGTGAQRSLPSHLICHSFRKSWTYKHHCKVCLFSLTWFRWLKLNKTIS